jgi:hypothetical protein
MSIDRSFLAENQAQRTRLQRLVSRLTDAELARPMPAGWSVGAVLGHLAFWDQRLLVLLDRCQATAAALPAPARDADVDWINDAAKPLLLAVSPRRAAELALAIAEAVDRKIEGLSDDFVARNVAAGTPLNLVRAHHRREHLDEIEQALTT